MSNEVDYANGIGTLYEITFHSGGYVYLRDEHEWERLDAMWTHYLETGKTYDRRVELSTESHTLFYCALSDVRFCSIETRESRANIRARDLAFKREKKEDGVIDD